MSGDKKASKGWAGGPPPWAAKSGDRPLPVLTPKSKRNQSSDLFVKLQQEQRQQQENATRERERQTRIQAAEVEQREAPEDPEEAVKHHGEMTRYHYQAMAHHFAMMYHHHNLSCESYMEVYGPEYDLRQYRPDIPSMPDLPDEWMEQNMQAMSPYYEYATEQHWTRPCPPTVPSYRSGMVQKETTEVEERDPALTDDEQLWINRQIDNVVMEHVTRQLEEEEEVPELICSNGGEPTKEDIDRFIEQVEVLEAWNAPITSVYTKTAKGKQQEGETGETDKDEDEQEGGEKGEGTTEKENQQDTTQENQRAGDGAEAEAGAGAEGGNDDDGEPARGRSEND